MEENNNSTSRNTNPTPQEQYQKEQLEKANFNPLDVSHSSTEDAYRRRKNKERHAQIEAWLTIAGLGGGAYGTAILVNKNPELAEFIAKLPGANRYSIKHGISVDNSIAFGGKPTNLKSLYSDQSLGRSLLSIGASIEELSPFGVFKTLQFTNILEPLTNVSREAKDVHISGSTIRSSLDYYDRLIHTMSGKEKSLLESDTKRGFLLRNNQLFRYLEDGSIDEADPVLKYVRMVTTHTKMGEEISPNRLLNKFANLLGTNLGYDSYAKEGTALIAGKSWKDLAMRWANAGFMHSMEIGYKTLDNPLQGVEELFKATGIPNIGKNGSLVGGIFDSNWYQSLKKKANIQLGTGGVYNTTTTDAMTRLGKNLVGKSLAAYVGYQAVNQVLDMVTPDSSAWNDGIISGLTANYANIRVGLAKVLADPFQRYKEAQENVADGSTSLITLAGFPIAGATAGASLAWYKRMKDSAFEGIETATLDSDIKVHKYGFAQGIAEKLKLGETNLSKSWGFRGAVIGAAIALPFLPGALIGESSEDLKASYSGERKEAYRASTGWLAGSEDIKGGHIKAFVPGRVARILSDAEDEVRYNGDNKLKRQLDPIYSPFSYLKNPYAFEEMHQDDMPYPVWGMNVDYGSFLGKIYQGTVGEFIKPTIINPQFLEDSRLIRTNAIENYRQQAQLDVNSNEQQSAAQTYHSSKLSLAANWLGITGKSGEYPIMSFAKPNERQMIDSGMMLAEESPSSDPHTLAAAQTYNALTDFTGLKGFTTSLLVNKMGYDPTDVRRQLARSGDAVSLADDFKDANVGDALGCFTPEMRVLTSEGYKEIQHIKIGDMVLSKGGAYRPVKQVYKKQFTDITILQVKVGSIGSTIYCTPDHIFPGLKRQRYSGGHAKPLTSFELVDARIDSYNNSDYVVSPLNKLKEGILTIDMSNENYFFSTEKYLYNTDYNKNKIKIVELLEQQPKTTREDLRLLGYSDTDAKEGLAAYRKNRNQGRKQRFFKLTKKMSKVIGWWLAEGSVEDKGRVQFAMHRDELSFAMEISEIVKEELGVESQINFKNNSMTLRFAHKPFAIFLKYTFGCSAKTKKIPFNFQTSREFCEGALYGLIHGDGWFCTRTSKGGFTSISKKLATSVLSMLKDLSVVGSICTDYVENRPENSLPEGREVKTHFNSRNNITIGINNFNTLLTLLEQPISTEPTSKDDYTNFIYNYNQYVKIRSIEYLKYTGDMYDLEIDVCESDSLDDLDYINYYTVENILVHNSGEVARRIIPMGAGSNPDDVNPMLNNAPQWLPNDPTKYFNDFSRGNPFSKIPLGEHRLPGKGLEAYRPELKGMDPNDYPLIYQYQVLSDVATNSPEHLSLKTYLLNADKEGKLSDTERDMFYESLTEEQAKKQRKQFSEYKSDEQFSKFSLGGKVLNTIWETAAHNAESPLETLTPFRPGAKFIHKRSAIEDYEMTMLNGPDTGIWTNPYSHFIRPAINRTAGILPGIQKPEHAEERDNVEEYFDKLEYLKARRNGRTNDVLRTVHGATAAGILDVNDFNKFSAGLSDNQRDYLQSFSKTTDSSDRRKILEMLPTDVAAGYQRIWNNLEVAEKAKKSGKDIDEAVKDAYIKSNMKELLSSRITGSNDSAQLDAAVMESKKQKAMSGQNFSRRDELLAKTRELKLREADKEAEAYVAARTGVPGEDWIGWDPRLKLDEVKLRTLQIGKADTYDYGFWDSDLKRNARIIALDDEDEVTRSYEDIKRTMRSDLLRKKDIERTMFNNGIFARRVILSDANTNNTDIRLQE